MEPGKICCMFNDLKSFMAFISLANNAGYFFVRDLKLFNGYIPCNRQAYLFVPRMVVNDEMLVRGIGEHAGGSCTISWLADWKYFRTATLRTCTCNPHMRLAWEWLLICLTKAAEGF